MRTNTNLSKIHREISFAFQYPSYYERSSFQSPAIAIQQKIQSTSKYKDQNNYESPLSNLYKKYLPNNQQTEQIEFSQISQTQIFENRQQNSKNQKFPQINKQIKNLLIEIQNQENRNSQFNQKGVIEISPNKLKSPSNYGKIKNIRRDLTQNYQDNTQKIFKARNIQEQMQKIDNKIQQLSRIKKQLQLQLPNNKYSNQNKIIESQLTKNFSQLTIKPKKLLTIDVQNQILQDSEVTKTSCKSQQKEDKKISAQIKIMDRQAKILVEDVQVPKILMKIKEKKIITIKETPNIEISNFLESKRSNFQENFQFQGNYQQNRNEVINQKTNLLNELEYQIKLDDEFRKSKKWLQKLKINNKWNLIKDQLQKNLYYITEQQIKNVFSLHQDQESPFYYPQEGDFTIENCIKVFLAADRHWNYDILHSYSQITLLASNFNQQNMDINGKGHINIQDITRYINSQLDKSYRNRDIYLIYHRFKTSEKLYFQKILNCLCNE